MGLARMQGKSVVISGAAFGIGRATAAKFAEEGASLLVQDIQERPLLAFRDELQRNGATVEAPCRGCLQGRGLPGNDPCSGRNVRTS
jgi:NAD(P)-dependent dehydrogenase (short-subunit alcohol dehydrogenase family)